MTLNVPRLSTLMVYGSIAIFDALKEQVMIKREEIQPITYEEIHDPLLRDDLSNLARKLKREVIDDPIRLKMPIAEFKKRWLSMFICKVDEKDQPYGIPVVRWINEVTGNPYTWVDIIEPNGEVAYSVPPLLNSDAVKVQHINFYHHIMEIQAMADHGAMKGEIDAYREKNILRFFASNEKAETWMNEINKMAMYHGYAPFTPVKGITPEAEEKVDNGFSETKVRHDEF